MKAIVYEGMKQVNVIKVVDPIMPPTLLHIGFHLIKEVMDTNYLIKKRTAV